MKRAILSLLIAIFFISIKPVNASHLLGGEITWTCVKSGNNAGKFIFNMKLYRACVGIPLPNATSVTNPLYGTYGGPSSITCTKISQTDLAPGCYNSSLELDCFGSAAQRANVMEEYVYQSVAVKIQGTPATTGSAFTYTDCCRPSSTYMQNINGSGYWLRAVMFPFTDPVTNQVLSVGTSSNNGTCYDSSPFFAERPATIICTGYFFTYNHNAVDPELDSLHYEWTLPMQSATNGVTWKAGYSVNNQLPTTYHNSQNVAATLNGLTGEIKFKTITPQGNYHSTAIKVSAYKCRQKVAEIYRDIPVILLACPPTPTIPPLANTPPAVVFKWAANSPVSIPLPAGDTVLAGDFVEFYITSTDVQFLPGFTAQTNYLLPSGSQFGTNFADSASGCKYPPCATLDTNNVFYNDSANWWEGQFGIATRFYWRTDCNHLAQVNACFTKSNTYNFIFKVLDNWCPAPGMNFQTFAVTVVAPPAVDPPELTCAQVMGNGDVLLKWKPNILKAEDTLNSFRKYIIYRSDSGASGPYDTLHIVQDIDSLQYLDVGAGVNTSGKFYVIQGISSCNDQGVAIWSDTISGMRLVATVYNAGNSVALNWTDFNPGNNWGTQTTGEYYVWQILNGDTTLIDTTSESWDTLQINLCYPSVVEYMITVVDTTALYGCVSNSSVSGGTVGDNLGPDPIILDSISYDVNNVLQLGWQPTAPDIGMYYIYKGGVLIDSIPGSTTTYSYTPSGTDSCVMQFAVTSRDTCGNTSSMGIAQYSMCTELVDVIRCDTNKRIIFSWNRYNPSWVNGAGYQLIYRSDNGGPYVLIDSVSGLMSQYEDTTIYAPATFRYRVLSQETGTPRKSFTSYLEYNLTNLVSGYILDNPTLECISWLNDSTIRLQWSLAANPDSNFNKYVIEYSPGGTNYTPIDSIRGPFTSDNSRYNTTTYTVTGVTDNAPLYRVRSYSGCDGQQTRPGNPNNLRAIDLQVTSISDSVNQLNWNPISSVQQAPTYAILRDGVGIGTTPFGTETMEDTWVVCNEAVTYTVNYFNPSANCTSNSKIVDGAFVDDTPPAKQFVDSVSMRRDTTFTAVVGWSKNPSSDVSRYYVMQCTPGSYKILDTLNAAAPRFYVDNLNAPLGDITQYTVMAEDSCGNNSLAQRNFDCHSTLFLNPVMDFCDQSILLEWNPYMDFTSGEPVLYDVFVSENGGPFILAGQTDASKYKYSDLANGNDYCFYIQGWDNAGVGPFSSSSAVVCLEAEFIRKPEFAYMRYVSVEDTNLVRMCMKIDLEADIGEYWVKRSNKRNEGYKVIATVALPDPLTPADSNFCYDDFDVNTNDLVYYYKIDVVDPCGEVGITSNHARTMLLDVTADNNQQKNVLKWNKYEEWEGGVYEYEIWRGSSVANMRKVRSLPVSQFGNIDEVNHNAETVTFIDDVGSEGQKGSGQFCYMVVAKEGTATFQNIEPEVSKSNIVCAIQKPLFYVPTAFTPNGDGMNDYFKPLGSFHDVKAYHLEVFNRWGERIYQTDNYQSKGWDGNYNGTPSPEGAYVYVVTYTSADNQEYEKRGTVALTRPGRP